MILLLCLGGFLCALLGSVFGVGSGLVILALITMLVPLADAVPLFPACVVGLEFIRAVAFRTDINWRITNTFLLGAALGTLIGANLYFALPDWLIATAITLIMLLTLWGGQALPKIQIPAPYAVVGVLHSILSTMFSIGGLFQTSISRARLHSNQVVATLAAAFFGLSLMKVGGYALLGYSYQEHFAIIAPLFVGAVPGTVFGKRLKAQITEFRFKLAFRLILSLFAIHILYRGLSTLF